MTTLQYVIFFSLLGGLLSLIGAILLLSKKSVAESLAKYATPFAAGALLAAVFLDLLQEGIEQAAANTVLLSALVGLILFFFAERFLHWFHHHHQHENSDPSKTLIIVGDTVHNALDGVAIAAAFLVSVPTGIVTTIAVAAHEIPQEIGDFGLLLAKGMSRAKVLWVNIVSALVTTFTAVITYLIGNQDALPLGVLLGLSAGFLLYIAASDIIPEIHEGSSKARLFDWQPLLLLLGVVTVGLAITMSHNYLEANGNDGHGHDHMSSHHEHEESCIARETLDTMGAPAPGQELPPACEEDMPSQVDDESPKVCIQIYPPPPGCE